MKPAILAAVTFALAAPMASAEVVCMDSDEMEAALIDWYQLQPVDWTETEKSVIWASNRSGIWATVSYDDRSHRACVVEQGENWTEDGGAVLSASRE
ncbi:S-adenosyl-L-homocysteine hydrolase [Mangrovicoccus algicola]|uniref:S-adenosyl-L-homocysteine hydrolase n=1 Tax=Mangrovicoccus algicola TaxID=2771008 RepID=A0A8J6Z6S8_9RHOB|nr:S-adenosyl-L-homocysteine hydrolase [Mangrovicoccus algicola]MBE3638919.1 S-adenosyl-L-homocysteine hydrolase [Mangrovicoccus algicola]